MGVEKALGPAKKYSGWKNQCVHAPQMSYYSTNLVSYFDPYFSYLFQTDKTLILLGTM